MKKSVHITLDGKGRWVDATQEGLDIKAAPEYAKALRIAEAYTPAVNSSKINNPEY